MGGGLGATSLYAIYGSIMKLISIFTFTYFFLISSFNFSSVPGFPFELHKNKFLTSDSSSILKTNCVAHKFSHPDKLDTFIVYIKGKTILDGEVTFIIKDFNGVEIFKETFPSKYLIDFGLDNGSSESENNKTIYIEQRITKFFEEENFIEPAIKLNEEYIEDYSDKAVWEDIHSDQTSIGFHYLLGEEDNRLIAYSKKMKKVVIYFNCC